MLTECHDYRNLISPLKVDIANDEKELMDKKNQRKALKEQQNALDQMHKKALRQMEESNKQKENRRSGKWKNQTSKKKSKK